MLSCRCLSIVVNNEASLLRQAGHSCSSLLLNVTCLQAGVISIVSIKSAALPGHEHDNGHVSWIPHTFTQMYSPLQVLQVPCCFDKQEPQLVLSDCHTPSFRCTLHCRYYRCLAVLISRNRSSYFLTVPHLHLDVVPIAGTIDALLC